MKFRFDNTESVRHAARQGERLMVALEAVAGVEPWHLAPLELGATGYTLNGRSGPIQAIEPDAVAISGLWHRREEVRPAPWTDTERAAYYAHRERATADHSARVARVIRAQGEKAALAREFVGR